MENNRILCVDDEKEIRMILPSLVEPWGYEMSCAKNAKEAHELFDAINPFLVVTDLSIANHVDGATLADQLHRKDPMCIFIALSGRIGGAFDLGYLIGAVFTDALEKPISSKVLKKIIDYAHEKRQRWDSYL